MAVKPVEIAAVLTAFCLYTGFVRPVPPRPYRAVIPAAECTFLSGTVVSSPVRTSSGKSYRVSFALDGVAHEDAGGGFVRSDASGEVTLFVDAATVEALYPGKLYTALKTPFVEPVETNRAGGAFGAGVSLAVAGTAAPGGAGTVVERASGKTLYGAGIPLVEEGAHLTTSVRVFGGGTPDSASGTVSALAGDSLADTGAAATSAGASGNSSGGADTPLFYAVSPSFDGFPSRLSWLRARMRLNLKRLLYSWGDAGGLLLALVSGEREYTGEGVEERFRLAGLSHILALSGMHLSLFAGLMQGATRRGLGKNVSTLLGLVAATAFVWFAGVGPSLVRSLLCMAVAFVSARLHLKSTPLENLSLAFLVQVALFPSHPATLAFMLSYAALIGVFWGASVLAPCLARILPAALSGALASSVGAFCCTAPLSLAFFGTCAPFGVLAAVVVTPLAEWFVTGGVVALLLVLLLPFLLVPVGVIMGMAYRALFWLVVFFARFPGVSL